MQKLNCSVRNAPATTTRRIVCNQNASIFLDHIISVTDAMRTIIDIIVSTVLLCVVYARRNFYLKESTITRNLGDNNYSRPEQYMDSVLTLESWIPYSKNSHTYFYFEAISHHFIIKSTKIVVFVDFIKKMLKELYEIEVRGCIFTSHYKYYLTG